MVPHIQNNTNSEAPVEPEQPERQEKNPETDQEIPDPFIPSPSQLPKGWALHKYAEAHHYVKIDHECNLTHAISLDKKNELTFRIGTKQLRLRQFQIQDIESSAKTTEDIEIAILHMDSIKSCEGDGFGGYSKQCRGGVKKGVRCVHCRGKKKDEKKKQKREKKKTGNRRKQKARERSKKLYRITKPNSRMRAEVRNI